MSGGFEFELVAYFWQGAVLVLNLLVYVWDCVYRLAHIDAGKFLIQDFLTSMGVPDLWWWVDAAFLHLNNEFPGPAFIILSLV